MAEVVITQLCKEYGAMRAVDDLSLHIRSGELIALLGPSGCGKTTSLRMVGGFITPTAGRITVAGRDVTGLPPNQRNMGFVFQNYALFPHMTVAENVAFGLTMRKVPRAERESRVRTALERVRLAPLMDRYPRQMSGGQQQRVALARALVIEPDVLLLDEPLSNLDASLRQEMKQEIRQLQQSLGLTTLFVTHDQDEAMSTADRMVLMRQGRIEQIGTPQQIFDEPASEFVAGFMGVSNLFPGTVGPDRRFVLSDGVPVAIGQEMPSAQALMALRPECIAVSTTPPGQSDNVLEGRIATVTFHGTAIEYRVERSPDLIFTARVAPPSLGGSPLISAGERAYLSWPSSAARLIPTKQDQRTP